MARPGQEKREGLRLDLNQDLAAGGLALNTPDLDRACEMALPTPVLNKKVLDMYAPPKVEPASTVSQPVNEPPVITVQPTPAISTTAAVKPIQQQQNYPQQSIIILAPAPAQSRVPSAVHPRIGQTTSSVMLSNPLPLPIDPSEQEKLKVERKRERNRAAAQRCREKKLKKIEDLSKDVMNLETQKQHFVECLKALEQTASQTLQHVEEHRNAGCDLESSEVNQLIAEAENLRNDISRQLSTISARVVIEAYNEADSQSDSGMD